MSASRVKAEPGKKTGRRPAEQRGAGRQEIWQAVKTMPEAVSVGAIVAQTGLHRSTVMRYLQALTEAGYLHYSPAPAGKPGEWRLARDAGYHAPRVRADGSEIEQGEVSAQLWRGMHMLREFCFQDLIQNAAIRIPEETAKAYCKALLACGYLRVIEPAFPRKGRFARYRLIRNHGPIPPQVQRVRAIFDPNCGTVFFPVEAEVTK